MAQVARRLRGRHVHPARETLTDYLRKCQARDMQQVLGPARDKPSLAVIAWTEGGALIGGTATALWLAAKHGIMVPNLGAPEDARIEADDIIARLRAIAK